MVFDVIARSARILQRVLAQSRKPSMTRRSGLHDDDLAHTIFGQAVGFDDVP